MSNSEPPQWQQPPGSGGGNPPPSNPWATPSPGGFGAPPAGSYPPGSYPPGSYPQGSYPPGSYPPAGYGAPPKARRRRRWPWVLLGVLVLIVAGIGSCSFIIFRAATAPIGAANDWLALVDEGRFDEAYAELCPALQGSGEEVVLADLAARFGNGLDSYDLTSYNNQNGFVTVAGQVAVTGAPSSIVTFSMEKVDGEWRVCGY